MIKKILIANRGEIALRIIRACKDLGIKTLSVYSKADINSLHVRYADESICIGNASASESYLNTANIISAALIGEVDAIHPGYGFLSENHYFAEQCKICNIKFIGPSHKTILEMGDKIKAIKIAKDVGCPVIPGSNESINSYNEACRIANEIKYPIMLKSTMGGGGKGIRMVFSEKELLKEYNIAKQEAEKSFGNNQIYIEKYIEEPRHIEFQILADEHGNLIHLFERDCSIQRNHQKLIEFSPSPYISESLRKQMGDFSIKIAERCKYYNVGTIEFLVDKFHNFYFIEMNPRIQVEHGVTEEALGIDLVKQQILVAQGEKLFYSQKDIKIHNYSIQCRINAENCFNNFSPSPGKINLYYSPGGPGVRIDSHLYSGYTVPPYYDSLISKIITKGQNRKEAIKKMDIALNEYIIEGIETTIPICKKIIKNEIFMLGKDITTEFINKYIIHSLNKND